jgi:hypothetical protein
VLYAAYGAAARGYTVFVAEDGIASDDEFKTVAARHVMLNQPGQARNPDNEPLKPESTTMSRLAVISFQLEVRQPTIRPRIVGLIREQARAPEVRAISRGDRAVWAAGGSRPAAARRGA